jgi:hypothetical protein
MKMASGKDDDEGGSWGRRKINRDVVHTAATVSISTHFLSVHGWVERIAPQQH